MRRPLTENGIPLEQTGFIGYNTIFDVQDYYPDDVYAVTLYCWHDGSTTAQVAAGVVTDGGAPVGVAVLTTGANFENYRVNGNGPAKVLDRLPLRGNQQLQVGLLTDSGGTRIFWYGYFERVGEAPVPVPVRPLLPIGPKLTSPYNAPVISNILAPDVATAEANVHQLDASGEQRLDYLWLDVATALSAAPAGTPLVNLKLPGGVSMPIPVSELAAAGAGSPLRLFDGIPFRAPTTSDNLFSVEVVPDAGAPGTATTSAIVTGHFARA